MKQVTISAEIAGVRYEIPEAWIMGYCTHGTVHEAIAAWHEQALMQEAAVIELAKLAQDGRIE